MKVISAMLIIFHTDCLDVLCVSLNEAPLHEENIPTLFFLAESSLYWLHVDAMKQPYLRTTEIKLFKVNTKLSLMEYKAVCLFI